ncbi:MAG: hypothetical protein IPF98_03365 [Gemmatimonadetes bacterium]|jgi:hypothetical protein|nr:hypothetical protein [Gemmatimonadota bacterium]MCC6772024.1 hypothetical protein [Gemmatimonadaceae bacterium]
MTRRFLVVALAVLTLGCQQEPNVPKIGTPIIALSMAFKSTTFQVGRPDTITVTATSSFGETARLTFDTDCQILLTIRSTAGEAVVPPNGRPTCLQVATTLDVPANGTVTRRFVWSGTTEFIPPGSATALPAGSYFVSASINATNYSTFAPAVRVELTTP